jgi:DNA polymerase-3 subunit chi
MVYIKKVMINKMTISFYELINTTVESTLPKLVQKIYDAKLNCHILCDTQERLDVLNATLWTFSSLAFLPHGTEKDSKETHAENPIWLSLTLDKVNNPKVLISLKPEVITDRTVEKLLYFYDQNEKDIASQFTVLKKQLPQAVFFCNKS